MSCDADGAREGGGGGELAISEGGPPPQCEYVFTCSDGSLAVKVYCLEQDLERFSIGLQCLVGEAESAIGGLMERVGILHGRTSRIEAMLGLPVWGEEEEEGCPEAPGTPSQHARSATPSPRFGSVPRSPSRTTCRRGHPLFPDDAPEDGPPRVCGFCRKSRHTSHQCSQGCYFHACGECVEGIGAELKTGERTRPSQPVIHEEEVAVDEEEQELAAKYAMMQRAAAEAAEQELAAKYAMMQGAAAAEAAEQELAARFAMMQGAAEEAAALEESADRHFCNVAGDITGRHNVPISYDQENGGAEDIMGDEVPKRRKDLQQMTREQRGESSDEERTDSTDVPATDDVSLRQATAGKLVHIDDLEQVVARMLQPEMDRLMQDIEDVVERLVQPRADLWEHRVEEIVANLVESNAERRRRQIEDVADDLIELKSQQLEMRAHQLVQGLVTTKLEKWREELKDASGKGPMIEREELTDLVHDLVAAATPEQWRSGSVSNPTLAEVEGMVERLILPKQEQLRQEFKGAMKALGESGPERWRETIQETVESVTQSETDRWQRDCRGMVEELGRAAQLSMASRFDELSAQMLSKEANSQSVAKRTAKTLCRDLRAEILGHLDTHSQAMTSQLQAVTSKVDAVISSNSLSAEENREQCESLRTELACKIEGVNRSLRCQVDAASAKVDSVMTSSSMLAEECRTAIGRAGQHSSEIRCMLEDLSGKADSEAQGLVARVASLEAQLPRGRVRASSRPGHHTCDLSAELQSEVGEEACAIDGLAQGLAAVARALGLLADDELLVQGVEGWSLVGRRLEKGWSSRLKDFRHLGLPARPHIFDLLRAQVSFGPDSAAGVASPLACSSPIPDRRESARLATRLAAAVAFGSGASDDCNFADSPRKSPSASCYKVKSPKAWSGQHAPHGDPANLPRPQSASRRAGSSGNLWRCPA